MAKKCLPVMGPENGIKGAKEVIIGYMIECPACGNGHLFYTSYNGKPAWTFNGNLENPTFSPSMLVYAHSPNQKRCHSFVRDGKIQFLDDCEHGLKGQTIDLPDME